MLGFMLQPNLLDSATAGEMEGVVMSMILAVMATIGIAITWATFPQIGNEHTRLAMGAIVSYGWPLCVVWFAWLTSALRPPRKGLKDQLLVVTLQRVGIILAGCWGLYVWQEMVTSPNRFYSAFLPFFALLFGGLPVLGAYWTGLLLTLTIAFECIMRFVPGHEPAWVDDPNYVAESYSSSGSDEGYHASSHVEESAGFAPELATDNSYSDNDTSGDRRYEPMNETAGSIYEGDSKFHAGPPDGRFENGKVYQGKTTHFPEIGSYEAGYIYSAGSFSPMGRYANGRIYSGDSVLPKDQIGRYGGGRVRKGTDIGGDVVAQYEGEDAGGAAAALLMNWLD